MNTFEKELSTKNLVSLLACKEGVDMITLGVEDEIDLLYLRDGAPTMNISGPARILIVTD